MNLKVIRNWYIFIYKKLVNSNSRSSSLIKPTLLHFRINNTWDLIGLQICSTDFNRWYKAQFYMCILYNRALMPKNFTEQLINKNMIKSM